MVMMDEMLFMPLNKTGFVVSPPEDGSSSQNTTFAEPSATKWQVVPAGKVGISEDIMPDISSQISGVRRKGLLLLFEIDRTPWSLKI